MVERLAQLFGVQPGYLLFGHMPKDATFDAATSESWLANGYGTAPFVADMEEADAPERAAAARKKGKAS